MQYIELNNGNKMPIISYGTLHLCYDECVNSVYNAIKCGYRSIDTAESYFNEEDVALAVKKALDDKIVTREELFITTKLSAHRINGYDNTIKYINESLNKLKLDYIDLFLIHYPRMTPDDSWKEMNAQSWRAMEDMVKAGKIKSLGVCNFMVHHLEELLKTAVIKPVINQIEFSPQWQQKELAEFCKNNNIQLEAFYISAHKSLLEKQTVISIANKYNKTPMQICARYCIQKNISILTRSTKEERMLSNKDIFDFSIEDEDMKILDSLNSHAASAWVGLPENKYETWVKLDSSRCKHTLYEFKLKLFNLITLMRVRFLEDKIKVYLLNFIPLPFYVKTRYKAELTPFDERNKRIPKDFTFAPKS